MLALNSTPRNAYRRVAVDARIRGASQTELVAMCFEQLVSELGSAIRAHEIGDPARRSDGLTRAFSAITALEMGLDRSQPVAQSMLLLYSAARRRILDSVSTFDRAGLEELREDFREIGEALIGEAA